MCKGQSPQPQIRSSIRNSTQNKLNSLNKLMDENLSRVVMSFLFAASSSHHINLRISDHFFFQIIFEIIHAQRMPLLHFLLILYLDNWFGEQHNRNTYNSNQQNYQLDYILRSVAPLTPHITRPIWFGASFSQPHADIHHSSNNRRCPLHRRNIANMLIKNLQPLKYD